MSPSDNVLIICRNLESISKLREIKPQFQNRYVLASDDPGVHEAAKEFLWIKEICWIEQMQSYYRVAPDVIRFIDVVNRWLKRLAINKCGFTEELFFFTHHVEGGMTSQRIQDALLLIRSYYFLFDNYEIKDVLLLNQSCLKWEDEVLREAARARNIGLKVVGGDFVAELINKMKTFLNIYLKVVCCLIKVISIGLGGLLKHHKIKPSDKEIVFQLCSSSYKHVENIVPLMKALKYKGYDPIALCWHPGESDTGQSGADQVRKEGLDAEDLEGRCSFFDVCLCIVGTLLVWKKVMDKKNEFLSHQELNFDSILLGRLLWPSILSFITIELPPSYLHYTTLKRYFKFHQPLAIRFWGAGELREGYLAEINCDAKHNPFKFFYCIGPMINSPYDKMSNDLDLLFVAGEIQKKIAVKATNISPDHIEICGQSRYEGLYDFKRLNDREKSLSFLGISGDFSMYVLYDSSCVLRGFLSIAEQAMTTKTLLNIAARYPSAALLVKPHPAHQKGFLEEIINRSAHLKNVFLIDKDMLPYHALNVADVLITKFSTIGIEAMMFDCPVVSCLFDNEEGFKIYENSADYLYKINELEVLISRLIIDAVFRHSWRAQHLEKQKIFLAQYFVEIKEKPSVYQAEVLDRRLMERNLSLCRQK